MTLADASTFNGVYRIELTSGKTFLIGKGNSVSASGNKLTISDSNGVTLAVLDETKVCAFYKV